MTYQCHDGGREAAGYRGKTGDCAARAIAIASGRPYQEVYDAINAAAKDETRKRGVSNARTGVYRDTMRRYLESLGATWTPTMRIGQGCTVHVRADELPAGRLVLSLSKHFAAFIDGVLHDTDDCSREGTRCVYGYWTFPTTGGTPMSATKSKTAHTPGPWTSEQNYDSSRGYLDCFQRIVGANEKTIGRIPDAANAAFIVTACNSHNALLAACRAARKLLSSPGVASQEIADVSEQLRAAIAQAEG